MSAKAAYDALIKRNMRKLDDYQGIVQDSVLQEIRDKAKTLQSSTVAHVNATNYGGGVAEILNSFVLLMNDIGIRTEWRVLHGTPDFFEVTKKFHNALQGADITFSDAELALYEFTNSKFASYSILDHDFVIIHDPQPLGLVRFTKRNAPWVWRCHIDITHPNAQAWDFIQPFIAEYERMVVSADIYRSSAIKLQQDLIAPSIDPLSPKNTDLSEAEIADLLSEHEVPQDKPLITQVSRFDPWKDPAGVLEVFKRVKAQADCRLVFCYNIANDDPEAVRIYNDMYELAKEHIEAGDVLFVRGDDPLFVNALQRASAVILQKSTREGFGLTVTEAMWKRTPVIASNVGGIPTQMVDGETGYLVDPTDLDGCADKVVALLQDANLRQQLGQQAQERVRDKFLITRHLLDYLNLINSL